MQNAQRGARGSRGFCAIVLTVVTVCCAAQAARADGTLATSAYVEYAGVFGDVYNGVTTDDGDSRAGAYKIKGRLDYGRLSAILNYRRESTNSITNATTPTGQPGTLLTYPAGGIVVPLFVAVDAEFETRLEYKLQRIPFSVGLAYSNSTNNYGFPTLHAFGIGVDLQPSSRRRLSPYGSYFYFPNQTGIYPLADPNNPNSGSVTESLRSNELEAGLSFSVPLTHLSIVAGYDQTTNTSRHGSFNFVRDGPYLGVGYRIR